jgi:hypothetical protein
MAERGTERPFEGPAEEHGRPGVLLLPAIEITMPIPPRAGEELADLPDDCSIGGCEGVCWKGSSPSSLALFRLPARALYGAGTLEHPDKDVHRAD